jgi:hypothetical protein
MLVRPARLSRPPPQGVLRLGAYMKPHSCVDAQRRPVRLSRHWRRAQLRNAWGISQRDMCVLLGRCQWYSGCPRRQCVTFGRLLAS